MAAALLTGASVATAKVDAAVRAATAPPPYRLETVSRAELAISGYRLAPPVTNPPARVAHYLLDRHVPDGVVQLLFSPADLDAHAIDSTQPVFNQQQAERRVVVSFASQSPVESQLFFVTGPPPPPPCPATCPPPPWPDPLTHRLAWVVASKDPVLPGVRFVWIVDASSGKVVGGTTFA